MAEASLSSVRARHVRLGIWIELIAVIWMVIEAAVALLMGFSTRSVAFQGFGFDSVVQSTFRLVVGRSAGWPGPSLLFDARESRGAARGAHR